jgi:hypothetical protein
LINFVIAGDPKGYEIETREDVGMHGDVEYMYYITISRYAKDHRDTWSGKWLPWNVQVEYCGKDAEVWYDGPLEKADPAMKSPTPEDE